MRLRAIPLIALAWSAVASPLAVAQLTAVADLKAAHLKSADLKAVDLKAVDFNQEVRPILSDRCFGCHGPDANKRKAGLRLDTAEGAYAALKSGDRAIVPGDLAASAMAQRIDSHDPDEVMPPPSLKRPLTDGERAILRRWIEGGAEYRKHWAFVAPERPAEPALRERSWVRDPLDAFVLMRLEEKQLAPEPEADRAMLLRRVSLALTGLPPTPEEIDAFVADEAPDAYERRVDALLASPRAAEHRATAWLDLARFADTFGYQSDGDSFTWPWRDWLLDSLASNMRYDRFATAMIAGDLMPAESRAQRQANQVASAFNRLHRMTEEGGSISEEFRQEGIADRVSTFGTAFLGLTIECARCHDHKYDPIPTREFYGLAAMFGSIDENGLKSHAHTFSAPPPFVRLANDEQAEREKALRANRQQAMAAVMRAGAAAMKRAVDDGLISAPAPTLLPAPAARYPFDELADGKTPNAIDATKPATTDRARPEQLGEVALADDGKLGKSLHFDGDGGVSLAGLAGFTRHDPVSVAFWINPGERNARAAVLHTAGFYTNDADGSGLELLIADGKLRWSVIHLWPGSAASVEMKAELPIGAWTHIVATYDGTALAARVEVNRLWTQVFGRGLIETSENFGLQGAWPSHVEVLDLLAADFARGEHAWDTNHMLRRLALSAVFRQSSATSDAKRARDPRNELLARGPSVRLSAEMLRDSALFASGLLVEKSGGPSVKPYQQPNLVDDSGANGGYSSDTGDAAHRRSLYTFRKRTVPPPTMLVFDAGSREACQSRRFATNTPLQALAIMNDPIFTECAHALAQRATREASDDLDARISRGFQLIASRAPRPNELVALRTLVTTRVASGEQDELAALTLACTTILASDAAIMSR